MELYHSKMRYHINFFEEKNNVDPDQLASDEFS